MKIYKYRASVRMEFGIEFSRVFLTIYTHTDP